MVRLSNEAIDEFKANYITSNNIGTTFLVLLALDKNDFGFLEKLDDSNEDKQMILLYRDLVYKGYLVENEDNENADNVHFSLTKKAEKLIRGLKDEPEKLEEVKNDYAVEIQEVKNALNSIPIKPKKVTISGPREEEINQISDWIKDWIALFPKRGAHNYLLRSAKGNTSNKMKELFRNNPEFNKNLIFDATKLYLKDQEKDGWKYVMIAGNFISKAEGGRGTNKNSTLAAYCELIMEGGGTPSKLSHLKDFNPYA